MDYRVKRSGLDTISDDVLCKRKGSHTVNICLNGSDAVISGSVDNIYGSLKRQNNSYWPNSNISQSNVRSQTRRRSTCYSDVSLASQCSFENVTNGNNEFVLRRHIPRASAPDLTNAYWLDEQASKASSMDEFLQQLNLMESQQYREAPIPDTKRSNRTRDPCPQERKTMAGHKVNGVTNLAFDNDDDNERTIEITNFDGNDETTKTVVVNNKNLSESLDKILTDTNRVTKSNGKPTVVDVEPTSPDSGIGSTNGTDLTVAEILRREEENRRTDDVKISMTDDVTTKEDDADKITDLKSSKSSTGIRSRSSRGSYLATSLQKAEQPPCLDENDEDSKWLEWIEIKFKEIAGDDGEIDKDEFKKALGVKRSFFADRFFELFDQDRSGTIELEELMDGLRMLTKGTPAQKLQFLFDVYDADASGCIDHEELQEVLKACMEESSLSLTADNLEDLTDALFSAADEDDSGTITFEELRNELEKHPGVIENLTISAAQWLKPPGNKNKKKARFRYFTAHYIKNNIRKFVYFWLYWAVNAALFAYAMYNYRESNVWVMLARGGGMCLNFNCMWILVLMLRKCLTLLRMTFLNNILPIDQHILFHKMTAFAIVFFAIEHSIAHIINAYIAQKDVPNINTGEWLFTAKAGVGFVGGSAYITGWLLDIILVIIFICSLPFVRKSGHFQVFYFTHMLYVPFWILVILHGPNFWKWFVAPGLIFIIEKMLRSKICRTARFGDIYIEEVNLLPSGVTHLCISRPTNFHYRPGDYIFIQIPDIATYEWHPFTISSAPEMEGRIWLHVRSAGHWTNKLYKHFDELPTVDTPRNSVAISLRGTGKNKFEGLERAMSRKATRNTKRKEEKPRQKNKLVRVKCFIDGPYGTGTREVFEVDHAVLIGSGIGVTPMASILQSIWYRFSSIRQCCPNCDHIYYPNDASIMRLKKVDFIWINRDQKSFEWFLTLLNQIEVEQAEHKGVLEDAIQMHMFMTAAQKKTDMKGIGLQIALDIMYEKSQRDLITGLRTKTEPGRPDWNKVFKKVKDNNKGKVKVFFCGAPALGKVVKESSAKFGFSFAKENF